MEILVFMIFQKLINYRLHRPAKRREYLAILLKFLFKNDQINVQLGQQFISNYCLLLQTPFHQSVIHKYYYKLKI